MEDDQQLVKNKPSYVTQCVTTLCCTMGAVLVGSNTSYSSPSTAMLGNTTAQDCSLPGGEALNDSQLSWYSSIVNVGAMLGVVLGGLCINWIGRRDSMVFCFVPNLLGWALIGFATNFAMLVAGRVVCGVAAGLATVAVPTYIGEFASPNIRGLLGSCFQLMVTIGVLYVYVFGAIQCWQWLTLTCLVPCAIFSFAMIFNKKSPTYLLANDNVDGARESLQHFRGKNFNVEPELMRLQESIIYAQANKASFKDLKKPHIKKPLIIAINLMMFQQISGINAILFNLTTIFESADVDMSSENSSILVAIVQVIGCVVAAGVMDKAGRRLMLIISSVVMAVSQATMGVYFYLLSQDKASNLGWMPITSLMIFIFSFSTGFGPIPWLMMGELFSADVRELASTIAALTCWFFAFLITLIFKPLQNAIHDYGVYWLFSGLCVISFFFSFFVVKETKGKTIQEITEMFGGTPETKKTDTVVRTDSDSLHM
ncbi:Sugar/inositol transporter [Trinorchestia longiramus]|nr:Sugar/inositol transporter [Trinorchestia longiramus]